MTGFLLTLLKLFAWLPVSIFAVTGHYPAWLVTPDDPVSPFGQYEATVRDVYARGGRYVGDVYWLGFRNPLYGLFYAFKPDFFKGLATYTHLDRAEHVGRYVRTVTITDPVSGQSWSERSLTLGPAVIITGHRLTPVLDNDSPELRHPNMDARPVFSIRRSSAGR